MRRTRTADGARRTGTIAAVAAVAVAALATIAATIVAIPARLEPGHPVGPTAAASGSSVLTTAASGSSAATTTPRASAKTSETSETSETSAPSADPPIDGQPSPAELARARADVAKLSDARLAGQVLVISYEGQVSNNAAALLRATGAGGLIVLGANVPQRVADRVPTMQAVAAAARAELDRTGRDWPAAVGIDQEGGVVTRIAEPLTRFPAPMAIGAAGDPDLARAVAEASGRELRAAGFTMTFGPSGDVTSGRDVAIGTRAISGVPAIVARLGSAMARGYADAGIVSTAKHFPGHGSVRVDSHVDRPVLSGSLETLLSRDLAPFARLAADRAPGIMVGHLLVPAVDGAAPATLSRAVLTGLLRERLGFAGLIVTDSMQMGAIARYVGAGPAAVAALSAGADVVLMPTDPVRARDGIVAAIRSGALPRDRVEEAAARMVATLRHAAARALTTPGKSGSGVPVSAAVGSNAGVAAELARRSVVQLGGSCGARLVGSSIAIVGGEVADRAALEAAARRAGLSVGPRGSDTTRVAVLGGAGMFAGLAHAATARATYGDVVVGIDNPTYLGMAHAKVAKIETFGRTPATWDALVAVLLGTARTTAKLPLSIEGAGAGSGC